MLILFAIEKIIVDDKTTKDGSNDLPKSTLGGITMHC